MILVPAIWIYHCFFCSLKLCEMMIVLANWAPGKFLCGNLGQVIFSRLQYLCQKTQNICKKSLLLKSKILGISEKNQKFWVCWSRSQYYLPKIPLYNISSKFGSGPQFATYLTQFATDQFARVPIFHGPICQGPYLPGPNLQGGQLEIDDDEGVMQMVMKIMKMTKMIKMTKMTKMTKWRKWQKWQTRKWQKWQRLKWQWWKGGDAADEFIALVSCWVTAVNAVKQQVAGIHLIFIKYYLI